MSPAPRRDHSTRPPGRNETKRPGGAPRPVPKSDRTVRPAGGGGGGTAKSGCVIWTLAPAAAAIALAVTR